METSVEFKNAVILAKESLTIDLMARIITGELSGAQVRELINRLYATMPAEEVTI